MINIKLIQCFCKIKTLKTGDYECEASKRQLRRPVMTSVSEIQAGDLVVWKTSESQITTLTCNGLEGIRDTTLSFYRRGNEVAETAQNPHLEHKDEQVTAAGLRGLRCGTQSFLAMVLHSNNPQNWTTNKINTSLLPVSFHYLSEFEKIP